MRDEGEQYSLRRSRSSRSPDIRPGARESERSAHGNRIDADASGQNVAASPSRNIPVPSIEPLSGQCRDKLGDNKSRGPRLTFAQREEATAQASPCPVRMNEERADPRRLRSRVEQSRLTLVVRIASEQRGTTTPASAKDQFVVHFSYEVGPVSNDLAIHTPYTKESRLDLLARVVARAEYSSGCRNERPDGRNVGKRRLPDPHRIITRIQGVRRRHVLPNVVFSSIVGDLRRRSAGDGQLGRGATNAGAVVG